VKPVSPTPTPIQKDMHAAQVTEWGQPPRCTTVQAPEPPPKGSGDVQVKVLATGLHNLVRLRASGVHYSAKTLPHTPGVDGVCTKADGSGSEQEYYFFAFGGGGGTFAEYVNLPETDMVPIPKGLDRLQVAALVNPVFSSWMALRRRTVKLPPNFSILVLGATTMSGALGVRVARALGASKVIGAARDEKRLAELGLDESIVLKSPTSEVDFSSVSDVDVILDFVYGEYALAALSVLTTKKLVQYINIGDMADKNVVLPAKIIRSRPLLMLGSGIGSWTMDELREELPAMLAEMQNFPSQDLNEVPLSDVESAWNAGGKARTVITV
jgi:NADPH:quinone reductase-like Zn-dependent oxidoreductase